jgi:hydrogenase-4 component E
MTSALDLALVAVMLLNVFALGTSRLRAAIRIVALQGALIGVLPLLTRGGSGVHGVLLVAPAVVLKGAIIPVMLLKALRAAEIKREVEPLVGLAPSLVLGALGTALAVAFSQRLPLLPAHAGTLLVPASLATMVIGFLFLTTRLKAITQVLGYLVLENGIFVFGLLLVEAMPFLLEAGVLLDLFVAVFVMGIILNHISREFSSMDTQQLSALKE